MPSLGFDILDRHVVDGRGDAIACSDETGVLTFAELLERSAALAGGLRALGVGAGDHVAVAVEPGNLLVQIVCACVRLGALPAEQGDVRIVQTEAGVTVQTAEEVHDLALLMRAGKTDPAPSLPFDPPGYVDAVRAELGTIIDAFLDGTGTQESTFG